MQTFNVFDFLKDIVSKVPDLGGSVATGDDHAVTKRRFCTGPLVHVTEKEKNEVVMTFFCHPKNLHYHKHFVDTN